MNASVQPMPAAYAANTKPLWAAVGVLGVAVLAMGASLVYVQTRPVDGHVALAGAAAAPLVDSLSTKVPVAESLMTQEDLVAPPAKPPVFVQKTTPVKPQPKPRPASASAGPVAIPTTTPANQPVPAPAPVVVAAGPQVGVQGSGGGSPSVMGESGMVVSQPAPVKPICANCGTVETVTAVQKKGAGSGVGTVAGGALGAVIGNQVGKGGGRTVATILGAIGGGVAGNMIEKNVRKETVYRVQVRMEDGSTRTLEQSSMPAVGSKVTVDGNALHSADGSWSAPARPRPAPQVQSRPDYDRVAL